MTCIDSPCCGCCDPAGDLTSPELIAEMEQDEMDREPWDGFQTDAEADADVLASAGMGTDEDYGFSGDGEDREYESYDEDYA